MQWIVAPESTTHRRFLDDFDRLRDESLLTFMQGGGAGRSCSCVEWDLGIVNGTPSVSMQAAINTERNRGMLMKRVMGTQSTRMRLRVWSGAPAGWPA